VTGCKQLSERAFVKDAIFMTLLYDPTLVYSSATNSKYVLFLHIKMTCF